MSKFFLQYHCQTLACLARKEQLQNRQLPIWRFSLPNASAALHDSIRSRGNIDLYNGLNIFIEVESDSDEEALSLSKNHCETILNLITFSTLAFCSPGELISQIEFGPQDLPQFRFYINPAEEEFIASPVLIDGDKFAKIYDAYHGLNDIDSQRRSMRALSWLRKGINEQDAVDEFTSYWVGLEVIKCRLRRSLKKSGQMKDPGEWDGVKHIYEETVGNNNFCNIELARNGLLHGFRELSPEFVEEMVGYVEPTRNTLIASITTILGLEKDILDFIVSKDVRRALKQRHVIEGDVEGIIDDFDRLVPNYPKAKMQMPDTKKYELDNNGNLKIEGEYNVRFKGPTNAHWHVKATELWIGGDSSISQAKLSVDKSKEK